MSYGLRGVRLENSYRGPEHLSQDGVHSLPLVNAVINLVFRDQLSNYHLLRGLVGAFGSACAMRHRRRLTRPKAAGFLLNTCRLEHGAGRLRKTQPIP